MKRSAANTHCTGRGGSLQVAFGRQWRRASEFRRSPNENGNTRNFLYGSSGKCPPRSWLCTQRKMSTLPNSRPTPANTAARAGLWLASVLRLAVITFYALRLTSLEI